MSAVTEPVEQLNAQRQAREHAWTADDYARCERNASIRVIVGHLAAAGPGWTAAERQFFALAELRRTFVRQCRVLGLGYAAIPGLPYDEGGPLT